MAGPLPAATLAETKQFADFIGREWARSRPDIEPVVDPRWLADMVGWLDSRDSNRVDRVMRHLRRVAPREYDVLHRTLLLGEGFEEVTAWLNERALRNAIPLPAGKPRHYEVKDAVALFGCGVAFVRSYW
jgi:hypothetical protein